MKICHVVGDSQYGGGSRIVLSLMGAALRAGHDVSVVATNDLFVDAIQKAGGEPVELDCVRRKINPLWDAMGCLKLSRHFRSQKYDLVQTHTSKGGMVGRFAAWLGGIPSIVHTVHGFAFHEESRPSIVSLISIIEKIGAVFCDKLVTVSHFHRKWALDLGIAPANKILAIPNGIEQLTVESGFDRDSFRLKMGVNPGEVMLLGLGRLAPQKGFSYLLDSCSEILLVHPECRLFIAGTGPSEEFLANKIATNGLSGNVSLLGFRSDIAELYMAADIVVQPSLWEGLSISLLEALSMGRPVVTTTINSNVEVLEGRNAARLVPVKDPHSLAVEILELAGDPAAREAMSKSAIELYLSEYTQEKMNDRYLGLYEELHERGRCK